MVKSTKKLAELIAKKLSEKKAEDVKIIDVSERTPFAEYYVLSTALNSRHVNALIEEIEELLEENKIPHKNIEGTIQSGWMLIDANGVIVNVFTEAERIRFNLDEFLTNNK